MKKIVLSAIALIVTGTLISFKLPTTKTSEVVTFQDANKGKAIYSKTCIACHQANGQGIPNAFPPLAKSDYLNKDVNRDEMIKTLEEIKNSLPEMELK